MSRKVKANSPLHVNFNVSGHSLISFQSVSNNYEEKVDWVFFSSSRSIQYYFEQFEPDLDTKYGCIGPVSANYLKAYIDQADFIGEGGNTPEIAKNFNEVASGKILFPQSNISLQNVQKHIDRGEVINLVVYKTKSNPKCIAPKDIYVFSSPSNVDAFLLENTFPDKAILIGIGDTTTNYLKNKSRNSIFTTNQPTEESVIEKLNELIQDGIIQSS